MMLPVDIRDLAPHGQMVLNMLGFIETHGPRGAPGAWTPLSIGYEPRPPVLLWTDRGLTPLGETMVSTGGA